MINKLPLFLLVFLCACSNNCEDWLKRYAATKCEYLTEQDKEKQDSINQLALLIQSREILVSDYTKATSVFTEKITTLQKSINKIEEEYMASYRKISSEQNLKYGHQSTPEYDKAVATLDANKASQLKKVYEEIKSVELKRDSEPGIILLKVKMSHLDDQINNETQLLHDKHKTTFDSLQSVLNNENKSYKYILGKLNKTEQLQFEQMRDSIRKNPCIYKFNGNE